MRTPYVVFALAYTAMFVLAFSAIGNFGLLTRQRTQVLPFVLVLLAMPARPASGHGAISATRLRATSVTDDAGG